MTSVSENLVPNGKRVGKVVKVNIFQVGQKNPGVGNSVSFIGTANENINHSDILIYNDIDNLFHDNNVLYAPNPRT